MTLDEYLSNLNERAAAKSKPKITDADFGLRVGLSQSQVSRLRRRLHRPSWATMEAIEVETGGKVRASLEDWPVKSAEVA